MAYNTKIELPTANGSAYFDPDRVVMVVPEGTGAKVVLENNQTVSLSLAPEDTARRLWGFTNAADNGGYFNDAHVIALVPHGSGTKMMFSQGGELVVEMPTDLLADSLRKANDHREELRRQR